MEIAVLDGYTENPGDLTWDSLKALGTLRVYDRTPADKIIERIGKADAVIVNKVPLDAKTIAACPSVKYIGVLATGYNVVDVAAAKERNIPVCNIPTYGTTAVSQFVFALLLEICHHVGAHDKAVHEKRWSSCIDWTFWDYPLMELAGKTIGIVGFGRIGQAVARIALGFEMKVLAFDAYKSEEGAKLAAYVSLEELYARSDIISLHCPLFPETQGMINKNAIAKMKDGVIIINTSRGPLVAEQDLADALNTGKVFAAGLDVVSTEPIREENPLLKAKNCFITPHIAWAPKESRARLMDIAVENLAAFIRGNPVNRVNL
jgi:glycerate dehydrogenase